jgi:DNA invertase Pin-like site-specific DNA recombinase
MGCFFKIDFFFIFHASSIAHLCAKVKRFYIIYKRFSNIYADEGLTGTCADKREDFRRMLADCKRGKIDRILTKSISHFARNTVDSLNTVRMLKALGIGVIFEKEGIDTAHMTGEFILTMHGMAAQEKSLTISGNLRWATRKRMAEGTFLSGSAPYGYRLQGRELVIYEPEATIVRKIFGWFLSGQGKQAIVNRLNREYPEKRWHLTGINYILSNPHYIGDALFQKNFSTGTLPYRKLKNEGQLPKYYVENSHPAIVDKDTWNRAQEELARRGSKRKVKQTAIKAKLGQIQDHERQTDNEQARLTDVIAEMNKLRHHPIDFDDVIVRQMVECVRVLSKERLLVCFRIGGEMEVTMA